MSASRNVMDTENAEIFPFRQENIFRDTKNDGADKIPHMEMSFNERLRRVIRERGLSIAAAERACGLGSGAIRKLLSNSHQLPHSRTLSQLAEGLGLSEQYLLTGKDAPASMQSVEEPTSPPPVDGRGVKDHAAPNMFELPRDVEVRGTAAGSHLKGAFQITDGPIEYVRRPPALIGVKDVYALYVEGSSMEPQFHPGDLVYIHPRRPAKPGDPIVVQVAAGEDHVIEGTIGIYVRTTEKHVIIKKHNPLAEISILRNPATKIHKIMTLNELFGL